MHPFFLFHVLILLGNNFQPLIDYHLYFFHLPRYSCVCSGDLFICFSRDDSDFVNHSWLLKIMIDHAEPPLDIDLGDLNQFGFMVGSCWRVS